MASAHGHGSWHSRGKREVATTTPIKHLVVIFQENVSFDHYFATYPDAANTDGTTFTAAAHTPAVDNLANAGLLTGNPNANDPQRLGPDQAVTCDQDHGYSAEQKAFNGGLMNLFVENTSRDACGSPLYGAPGLTMDYYDGNTVTALWNYAQHYAMSDNSYSTTFGPSTPGALNLVSGQTHGVTARTPDGAPTSDSYAVVSPDANGVGTVINDPDPYFDDCANKNGERSYNLAVMHGRNVGDLLDAKGVTWGWFQGGFRPTTPYDASAGSTAVCGATSTNVAGVSSLDYSAHHEPFQYYESTANPHHLPPTSVAMIGRTDQANHQYDMSDFDAALAAGNLPAVSFLKAPAYQDGHAAYSDPLDEQNFLVKQINAIQTSRFWSSTAIVVLYDDSDGWYDHVAAQILNGSNDPANDSAICTDAAASVGVAGGYQDRCGPGTRQPLLVISPFSKTNYVDHAQTEQASVLRLIEDNWRLGRIGDASADARAGSLLGMLEFHHGRAPRVLLNADGSVAHHDGHGDGRGDGHDSVGRS
ncbi:alkaline phosphatase family protein [Isoptericola sp. b441]|uniref:Alkaline phosphatase family protein n=1 Tax=Actinotalea lenta TaxID=3064654 RepID=A0ABT9D603_9CELL|nr:MULTISPECIES: alkaline phosphatase family protein [unclassified Isoptericola]MDO8106249.1 alkaline phosphatase family protein [Isoptericola sp. b441]MDO8122031.1 alkaline phosphatase family protein [Isoptericola sp. b490]